MDVMIEVYNGDDGLYMLLQQYFICGFLPFLKQAWQREDNGDGRKDI